MLIVVGNNILTLERFKRILIRYKESGDFTGACRAEGFLDIEVMKEVQSSGLYQKMLQEARLILAMKLESKLWKYCMNDKGRGSEARKKRIMEVLLKGLAPNLYGAKKESNIVSGHNVVMLAGNLPVPKSLERIAEKYVSQENKSVIQSDDIIEEYANECQVIDGEVIEDVKGEVEVDDLGEVEVEEEDLGDRVSIGEMLPASNGYNKERGILRAGKWDRSKELSSQLVRIDPQNVLYPIYYNYIEKLQMHAEDISDVRTWDVSVTGKCGSEYGLDLKRLGVGEVVKVGGGGLSR